MLREMWLARTESKHLAAEARLLRLNRHLQLRSWVDSERFCLYISTCLGCSSPANLPRVLLDRGATQESSSAAAYRYPLSSYAEIVSLSFQAAAMLALVCFFQRIAWPLGVVVVATGAFAVVRPCLQQRTLSPVEVRRRGEIFSHVQAQVAIDPQVVDSTVLPAAQIAASLAGSVAIAPQLWRNALRGASGEFSPVSASMLAAGNAGRLWTTTVLTQDPLLLGGFALGCGSHFPPRCTNDGVVT